MPSTVNGCGSGYVGARNVVVTRGACPHCKRNVTLRSYDTRLCLVFIFIIPVFPLRRYRIIDECPSCRRHRRISLAQYRQLALERTRPLEEKWKAGDAEAGHELARVFLGFQQYERARVHLLEMIEARSQDAEAHHLLAAAVGLASTDEAALPHAERAFALEPEKYREPLAFRLQRANQPERAETFFRELLAANPDHPAYTFQLARALAARGRFDEALPLIEKVERLAPDAKGDPDFLSVSVRVRQKKAPIRILDAASIERERRRQARLGIGVLALILLGSAAALFLADRHVTVVVDNPSNEPLRVRADGEDWVSLPPNGHEKTGLARGPHVLDAIAGVGSGRVETFHVDVEAEHLDNVMGSPTYVFDPLRQGIYCDYQATYGDAHRSRMPEYHAAESWFRLDRSDYPLVDPPSSIELPSGSHGDTKRALKRMTEVSPFEITGFLLSKGRSADAVHFIQSAIERAPDDQALFQLLFLASRSDAHDEVAKWIEARRTDDPASIHFHRVYQDSNRAEGNAVGLEHEYARRLETSPDSPFALYLYGRVAPTDEAALAAFEKASERDPAYPWPHLGAAHVLAVLGRLDEALPRYRKFLALASGKSGELRDDYWEALCEAGAWDELERDAASVAAAPGELGESAAGAVGVSLVVRGAPEPEWAAWVAAQQGKLAERPWFQARAIDRLRALGKRAEAERTLADLEARGTAEPAWAQVTRAAIALAAGDRDGAEKLLGEHFDATHPSSHGVLEALLLGIVCEWHGERPRALRWYDRAAEVATTWDDHELCRFLLKRASERALAAGDRHRSSAARAVSLLAQAVRAEDEAERERLRARAEACGAWQLSEAWYVARSLAKASSGK